jgi:WD40 repeat protein/tRNA A-37 threonylcarbamoyl transferase component Bud32
MREVAPIRFDGDPTLSLDSIAWEGIEDIVRSFRRALVRGENPAIEEYVPERVPYRTVVVIELIQEEMEFQIKAGQPSGLSSFLERFPAVANDPRAVSELVKAESELQGRMAPLPGECSTHPGKNGSTAEPPVCVGRYELREVIGQGAFGVVYRAWDTELLRTVALKRPRAGALEAAGAIDRFLREARSAGGLRHPHIVSVHDVGQVDGEPFLVSALVEGRDLAQELAVRRVPFRQAAVWAASLAEALAHAHGLGVVHRDVKPSNVLIDGERRAYLTDFGLAKNEAGAATFTIEGQLLGTPAYMAPEQARGQKEKVDGRADIYALGVILYELLTGMRPFVGAVQMLLVRIQEEDPQPPRRLDDTIPRDLETICLKCLRKSAADRYSTAAALAEDLRRHLAGRPILARPISSWGRTVKWVRRRPAMAALSAVCTASAIALFGSWLWQAELKRRHAQSIALVARQHADELQDEAQATRRHLYAVEVGRAYDAWEHSHAEQARQILDRQRPGSGEDDLRGLEWNYLWRLCDGDLVLRGHQGRVRAMAYSHDGRVFATASDDHVVKIWDPSDWRELATLTGHERAVVDLAFSPDGSELFTGSYDGSVRRWDVHGLHTTGMIWRGPGAVLSLAVAPDGKTLAFFATIGDLLTNHTQLRFLDLATGKVDARDLPNYVIWSLAYSPDGRFLVDAGGHDHLARLWNPTQRRVRVPLKGHSQETLKVQVSPDGNRVATTSTDETIRVWDPASGQELARQSSVRTSSALAFSPDSRILAFANTNEIRLWDMSNQDVRKIPTPHLGPITSLAFSPDQKSLASGGDDGMVRVWDPQTARAVQAPVQPRGERSIVEPARPELLRFDGSSELPYCIAISPDGSSIAAGGSDGSAGVWDTTTGTVRRRLPKRGTPYRDLLYFSDGHKLAAAITSRSVPLYDIARGTRPLILSDPGQAERPVWSLALSPDERFMVAAIGVQGDEGTAAIWDLSTGELRTVLRGHSDYVRAVAFAHDGQILATGSGDETIKLWDFARARELATLAGHRGQVFCLAFQPGGGLLASGSEDHTIRLWEIRQRRQVAILDGHAAAVHSVTFSPDGARLASAGRDGGVFLWDVTTGRKVGSLIGHTERVNQVKFFPDGKTLLSASVDRTIRFWYTDPVRR